ncbi:hypothetical protein GWM83_00790, partial [Candidatus Bathyarchaeota archaeon]|nr:hypothetical protein [Candidatus Bathyarchaeota archaeon]NIW34091.1 hypothetical protein [Candidatus Bathyarchaeota archaeon]
MIVLPNPETGDFGIMFFLVFRALFALANVAVYLYATKFRGRGVTVSQEKTSEPRRWAAGSILLGTGFSASLMISSSFTVLWDFPLR